MDVERRLVYGMDEARGSSVRYSSLDIAHESTSP
jgi:hypothetical protein